MTGPDQLPPELAAALLPAADLGHGELDHDLDPLDPGPRAEDEGRLTRPAALAELDRATPGLLELEHRHGFTFTPGPPPPPHAAAVSCSTPTCERRGRLLPLHDDTVQPVHCGGCGAVVHCDHVQTLRRFRAGTIGAPLEVTVTECERCGVELGRAEVPQPPIDLASLPVSILENPLDRA